jgi:alkanesulfonate monooxygenase SsuD/methylene tetrahydromethanopterin reductase-like flavin-dependent oxidoreductase (luciferase family)
MLGRIAAAVDDLSDRRLVLGLGAGWNEREHRQFGIPFFDVTTRREMFFDELEILTRLLVQTDPVTYIGKHFSLDGAELLPHAHRRVPILIGGNGPKHTLPLVVQYADKWNGVVIAPSIYRT